MSTDPDPYPKTAIGRAMRSFWDFIGVLTGSGARKVRPLQQQLLDALLPALDPAIRKLVSQQLVQPYYMQFWHGGRISPFFFKDFNLPKELRISNADFADKLYKVEMFVDGRKETAHVTFYNGRIHTLEFKKPFGFYEGRDIRFGTVRAGKSKESFTRAIDRYEHGSPDPQETSSI